MRQTGNYYYGARYYDPRLSIFLSVDPLVEKTMTAYAYCDYNPIMFTDPHGTVNGVGTVGIEVFINNLYQNEVDSIRIKNKSDSLRYIQEMNNRSDSLLNPWLKR